jgi:hypothetical protein
MAKSKIVSKIRESLKNPEYVDPDASYNRKTTAKSPKRVSKSPSPKRVSKSPSPKRVSKSPSPKRVSKSPSPRVSVPSEIPGVVTDESFEARYLVERPSAEKYANNDIIKKNPKVSLEELSVILGVTKIVLPKIDTNVKSVNLPKIKPSSPKKSASPKTSPKASPKRSVCNIMLGDKPVDKNMIGGGKDKSNYSSPELKQIAIQLGISSTGIKAVLAERILKELEKRGC